MNRKNHQNRWYTSKGHKVERYILTAIAGVAMMLTGCESYSDEKSYDIHATRERLRQIQTLDTDVMKPSQEKKDALPVEANEPASQMKVTLEDCRAIALQNNLEIKTQLISPAIAAKLVSQEEAKFEAVFFSNASLTKTDTPTSTTLEGSSVDSRSMNMGVELPLKTGGSFTFNMADNRTETDHAYSTLNPAYTTDTSLSISQPLLRNAGTRVSMYSIRIAEYSRQISEAQTKLEVITVLAAADRVYWRLYAARRELEVRKRQYELAQSQLERVKRLVAGGSTAEVEIVRAEAGVAERLGGIITAENSLRQRERELKRILNKPQVGIGSLTVMIPGTEPDPVRYQPDRHKLVAEATANRMEMLELELQLAQSAGSIDFYKNQTLPLLGLNYTYNINGLGETRSDAYDLMLHNRFTDHRVGLQLEVPLGNEAAKSRLAQAYLERRQKLATKESRQVLIEQEVLNAVDQLESNWQQIMAGRQNSLLSGRLYEAEERQFRLGLRTSTDVLDAQTKFAEAQSQEITALTQYQIALVDMAYATGTVLGAAKVEWQPDASMGTGY
jgi:outer membrane protein